MNYFVVSETREDLYKKIEDIFRYREDIKVIFQETKRKENGKEKQQQRKSKWS
tara:strand:- start:1256 stop:1414 length:159 start_codon:yes stop_codon:yes gene_type:complete